MFRRLRCGLWLGALAICALLGPLGSARLHAQAPTDQDAPPEAAEDRAQSFQSVSGAVKEDIPGGPLMLAAYAVVWLAVFGYVFRLGRLHARLEDNLSRVERALAAGPANDAS
jgi:CcmD family protein